jgi:SET domain-containing protein
MLKQYGLHVSTPIESSSGPQCVDPDIQTFTALRDPQRLQNKKYVLYIYIKHQYLRCVYTHTQLHHFESQESRIGYFM